MRLFSVLWTVGFKVFYFFGSDKWLKFNLIIFRMGGTIMY